MDSPDARRFEGTWKLLPERCVYEFEKPPREGTYKIAATPEGLSFILDWVDSDGDPRHSDFRLTWAGDDPASLELVDERTLNTTVEKNDQVVAHASRRLQPDGTQMEVVQQGVTPQGKPFLNRAWYVRQP